MKQRLRLFAVAIILSELPVKILQFEVAGCVFCEDKIVNMWNMLKIDR